MELHSSQRFLSAKRWLGSPPLDCRGPGLCMRIHRRCRRASFPVGKDCAASACRRQKEVASLPHLEKSSAPYGYACSLTHPAAQEAQRQ
jgi:hypothetical protein